MSPCSKFRDNLESVYTVHQLENIYKITDNIHVN